VGQVGLGESTQQEDCVLLQKAGRSKEIADKVRQGKAFLRVVGTPWGVEFYICQPKANGGGLAQTAGKGIDPSFKVLYTVKKAEASSFFPHSQPDSRLSNKPFFARTVIRTRAVLTSALLAPGRGRAPFLALTVFCMLSNLVAFAVTSRLSLSFVELNPLVQPGSPISLLATETAILIFSAILLTRIHDSGERTALQSLIAGVFGADALNDLVLLFTGDGFLAAVMAWLVAASIPTVVCIELLRRSRRHAIGWEEQT